MAEVFGFQYQYGGPRSNSRLLRLAWPSFCHCSHLGSETSRWKTRSLNFDSQMSKISLYKIISSPYTDFIKHGYFLWTFWRTPLIKHYVLYIWRGKKSYTKHRQHLLGPYNVPGTSPSWNPQICTKGWICNFGSKQSLRELLALNSENCTIAAGTNLD